MSDKKTFKMSDDLIAVIRELVQLSLITGTNIVDHLRAVEIETEDNFKLIPTMEYIDAYNTMVEELVKKANESQKKLDASLNDEDKLDFVDPEDTN